MLIDNVFIGLEPLPCGNGTLFQLFTLLHQGMLLSCIDVLVIFLFLEA